MRMYISIKLDSLKNVKMNIFFLYYLSYLSCYIIHNYTYSYNMCIYSSIFNGYFFLQLNYTFQSKRVSLRLTSSSKESVIIHKYDKLELNADASSRIILDENQQCGDNCSCVFSHWYSERLIKLQCTRFNGIKLQPKIPERIRMLSQTSRVEFHLQQCNIMDLEVLQIADYLRQIPVRKLSLSNNRLSSVQQLADSLTNLEVSCYSVFDMIDMDICDTWELLANFVLYWPHMLYEYGVCY